MTEGLFILTTIFVAYVVYVIVGDSKAAKTESKASPAPAKKPEPKKTSTPKPAAKAPAAKKVAPAKKSTSRSKPKPKPAAVASADVKELRNPENGEISKIASNYRFMKRWIKDALVSEGFLDQVYKNNAIDDAAAAKIDAALEKIKALDKYKV